MKQTLFLLLCLGCLQAGAQSFSGRVRTTTGQPVAAATVRLNQTGPSVMADAEGTFAFQDLRPTDTLYVTAVGYEPAVFPVGNNRNFTIILQPALMEMQEVIVNTGYQKIPRERSTGSYTIIAPEQLEQQFSTDVLSRLEGVANSLSVNRRVNSNGQLMIRGLSTIQGPRSPLIVVDNFPFEGDIGQLNPNDVESVTLLKDAAAASIWGARAGNGVVVITTKKGRFQQPLRITFHAALAVREEPDLFYNPRISSADYVGVEQFLFSKGYLFSDTANRRKPPFSPAYEILFRQRSGQISDAEAAEQLEALRNHDVRHDFLEYLYRPEMKNQYALSVQGGSQQMSYLLSAGYDRNTGTLADQYSRISLRLENTFQPVDRLRFTTGISLTQTDQKDGCPGISDIMTSRGMLPPYTMLADSEGNALPLYRDYRQSYVDTAGSGKLLDWNYYPLADYQHVKATNRRLHLMAQLGLEYKLMEGLGLELRYQLEQQQGVQELWQGAESYYTRDLVNSFTQINRATGAVFNPVPKGDIMDGTNSQLRVHNARGQLNFNRSWERHHLAVIAGGELRQLSHQSSSNRAYGYSREILTSAPVNYAQTYPNFVRGSQTFIPSIQDFNERLDRFVSLFSNLAYTWDGKYTASLSGRRDASNLFGVATNDKWNPLWSAGLSWHLSRERFYRSGALPYLKLRATWGYSGNVDPSLSALTTLRYMDVSPYTSTPYAQIDKYYNPELRWEKIGMLNLGLDFQSRDNRVSGSLEYYAKKGRDLFGPAPVDYTVGLNTASITKNVAAMKGHGVDLEVRTVNIDKGIQWTTHWNLSHNRDQVTRYYLSTKQGSQFINGGQGISGIEGKPVYSVFTYRWGGLDPQTGDPVGFLKGGESKDYASLVGAATLISDLVYHGPALPQWYGTLGNTVRWKGLALTAQLNYKFGYYFQRNSISYADLFSKGDGHGDFARRWQKPGDEQATHVPSMTYPINASRDQFYRGSEVLVSKGDHIRLQYLHLSYEWLKGKSPWLPFSQLQLYVNIQDLGIVWRAGEEGIDPDYRSGIMPPSKSFAVGIRTSF